MNVPRSSDLPAKVLFGFLGLLLATVAALMIWPFYRPLLWFWISLMTAFFLFAFVVISFSIILIFRTARRSRSSEGVGSTSKNSGRSAAYRETLTATRASELWDPWLDGS